jgi:serine/threonine protein kinase
MFMDAANSQTHKREDQMWSRIRHPNILRKFVFEIYLIYIADLCLLEFLGANILDDKPFIVMPYLKHGNVRAYLNAHPDDNRLQIVRTSMLPGRQLVFIFHVQLHGISLGLVYLHSHQIVHGDLKAVSCFDSSSCRCIAYCNPHTSA